MENLNKENNEHTQTELTPMGRVWKVICATMLGTALIGYGWHAMEMSKQKRQNARAENEVVVNIAALTVYRDQLQASASATIPILPPQ